MSRFVVIGLLVLAWAFWELSGGADFVPPSKRAGAEPDPEEAAPKEESAAQQVDPAAPAGTAPAGTAPAPELPRLALAQPPAPTLRQAETAPTLPAPAPEDSSEAQARMLRPTDPEETDRIQPDPAAPRLRLNLSDDNALALDRIVSDVDAARLSAALEQARGMPATQAATPPVIAPEVATMPEAGPAQAAAPAADIREVTATRVNLRAGPGIEYGVIDRLTQGTRVEILWDPGAGWVKLRAVDGGPEGWMADSLLAPVE